MEDDATATATAASEAVSKVLDDDDLLDEILLRVGFPTTLVRAAAVCRRWLHHASDPAFLRRFRDLHPPRLLGFYLEGEGSPRFVPLLPQPPELSAAVRIAEGYGFGAGNDDTVLPQDSKNGSVFTLACSSWGRGYGVGLGLHSPLCPERAMAIDPPISPVPGSFLILSREEEEGGGGVSYFYLLTEFTMEKDAEGLTEQFTAHVYKLRDGAWCMHTSATTQAPPFLARVGAVLVDTKIYMTLTLIDIAVFDLTTSSFSTIQLPPGVEYYYSDFMLSRSDDASSVYLIEVKAFELRVLLYKGDSWSIVDTICL